MNIAAISIATDIPTCMSIQDMLEGPVSTRLHELMETIIKGWPVSRDDMKKHKILLYIQR